MFIFSEIMKKASLFNSFEGEIIKPNKVRFLDADWDIESSAMEGLVVGDRVSVEVEFADVDLQDYEEEGKLSGEVAFILYKGNHYHLTIRTDEGGSIEVNTNDVWDDGDRVGIMIAPQHIRLKKLTVDK